MSSGLSVFTPPRMGENQTSPKYMEGGGIGIGGQTPKARTSPRISSPSHSLSHSKGVSMSPLKQVEQTLRLQSKLFQVPTNPGLISRSTTYTDNPFKFRESAFLKRKYSFGNNGGSDGKGFFQKKRRKHDGIVLPTKFLLGGNIHDPLNLASLADDKNQVTPHSSPLPTPRHKKEVEVLIPANINDPLNLNSGEDIDELSLISPSKGKGRNRKRRRKRTDSETTIDEEETGDAFKPVEAKVGPTTSSPLKAPQILSLNTDLPTSVCKLAAEKIVSPVVPQGSSQGSSGARHRKITPEKNVCGEEKGKQGRSNRNKKEKKPRIYRPQNARFIHGNYNRYYGYRNHGEQQDVRLNCFKKEWFEEKEVLDLGCNAGHITLTIARDFRPKKIIGLDIDQSLITIARKNVRHYITSELMGNQEFPLSLLLCHGPLAPAACSALGHAADEGTRFPNNVLFLSGNYAIQSEEQLAAQRPEYDCILCLSLTKWIHLNGGDECLKRVFRRIFAQLRPGGRLILEAQPWCSYSKRHTLTEAIDRNYKSIRFKPEQFNDYLLSKEVGFTTCELIGTPAHESKGFRRPIYLFTKPDIIR